MTDLPAPPAAFVSFTQSHPELAAAWEAAGIAGREGPLDSDTVRLIKLAVAIGAMREGAVHASVRKALAQGIPAEALDQIVAISAGTIGFPATVAAHTWVHDVLDED